MKGGGWRTWVALQDQCTRARLCVWKEQNGRGRVLGNPCGLGDGWRSVRGREKGRLAVNMRRQGDGTARGPFVGRREKRRRRSGGVDAALLTLLWPTRTARGHDGVVVVGVLITASTLTCTSSSTRAL